MACFLVPAAEGIVSTVVTKAVKNKENSSAAKESSEITVRRIPFSEKLSWLTKMLFGGSALLAFEHVWHGEVVPYFPFLTAMNDPSEMSQMLHEMGTVGVTMAVIITLVWGGMVAVSSSMEKAAMNSLEAGKDRTKK